MYYPVLKGRRGVFFFQVESSWFPIFLDEFLILRSLIFSNRGSNSNHLFILIFSMYLGFLQLSPLGELSCTELVSLQIFFCPCIVTELVLFYLVSIFSFSLLLHFCFLGLKNFIRGQFVVLGISRWSWLLIHKYYLWPRQHRRPLRWYYSLNHDFH